MTKNKASLDPKKKPRQKRSLETMDVILEAASQVLAKEGYEAMTTTKVAERAGVGIGSLYEYFADKESICAGVKEYQARLQLKFLDEYLERNSDQPLKPFFDGLVREFIDFHLEHPKLFFAIGGEVPRFGRLTDITELEKTAMTNLAKYLDAHTQNHPTKDRSLIPYLMVYIVENTILKTLLYREEYIRKPEFAEELSRVAVSYLEREN